MSPHNIEEKKENEMKSSQASSRTLLIDTAQESRRRFIRQAGTATFSGIAVALLGGRSTALAASVVDDAVAQDIRILNTAAAAEHEAVAAYQLGAESGLLQPEVLKVAVAFQDQHKQHVDALAKAVRSLGGQPAGPRKDYGFPVDKLTAQEDVLQFAAGLERGAVSAYVGAIPLFDNRDLSAAAASILADEAMHWAVLRQALGLDPVPGAFFS
jgi:rubrerythrin